MYGPRGRGLGAGHWVGAGLMLLFWALLITLAVLAIRWFLRNGRGGAVAVAPGTAPASASALQILDERYARGEISHEEFVQRRALLRGDSVPMTSPPPAAGDEPDPTS